MEDEPWYRIEITMISSARDGTPKTSTRYYLGSDDDDDKRAWTSEHKACACLFQKRAYAEETLAGLDLSPKGNLCRIGKVVAIPDGEILTVNPNDIDTVEDLSISLEGCAAGSKLPN